MEYGRRIDEGESPGGGGEGEAHRVAALRRWGLAAVRGVHDEMCPPAACLRFRSGADVPLAACLRFRPKHPGGGGGRGGGKRQEGEETMAPCGRKASSRRGGGRGGVEGECGGEARTTPPRATAPASSGPPPVGRQRGLDGRRSRQRHAPLLCSIQATPPPRG